MTMDHVEHSKEQAQLVHAPADPSDRIDEQKPHAGLATGAPARTASGPEEDAQSLLHAAERQHRANDAERARLDALRADLFAAERVLEGKKTRLAERERAVEAAERKRDEGFADEREAFRAELGVKRATLESSIASEREKRLSALEDEIARTRGNRLEEVARAEQAERDRVRAEIARERDAWTRQQDEVSKQIERERTDLERQRGALSALRSELDGRRVALEAEERNCEDQERLLERRWQRRNERLDDEVESRVGEARRSLQLQKESFADENTRLRESIRIQTDILGAFEQLKRQLGGRDPAEIIRHINSQTDELKRLHEELATRPTQEMRDRFKSLESKARTWQAEVEQLRQQIDASAPELARVSELRRKNEEISAENRSLAQRASIFEAAATEAQAALDRLRAAYERPAELGARYKEIEAPLFKASQVQRPARSGSDEMQWLTSIGNECDTYGLHFNSRILKAFHTALKTAELSPLTVLAGVSGTGKSELPRLYSHFGGLVFEPISVQPNWDSQESMLGFFNSIDNKFDAQPVLRLLAQSQKAWVEKTEESEGYPGLAEAVCLVLLDEMNLAHPELYFAEFLSKLELRRGKKGAEVPLLPVKIGAGMQPYPLALGRNVLWAGTMNQDETTKSLSDKVIDRSIIIHFPRPTELKRRVHLVPLDEKNRGRPLHRQDWNSWLAQSSSFVEEDVAPFKRFIEEMNANLAVAGRAIGHRVWQSVEYYMANYPDVRAAQQQSDKPALAKAMHVAFEDQLVQKVMPKLRGIDTRGKSMTECLEKIRGQINAGVEGSKFNLDEDFETACELGYGQFIWQSANYLNSADTAPPVRASAQSEATAADDEPPALFQKDQKDQEKRRRVWNAKSPEDRARLRQQLIENERTGRIA
jgi:hypothetical protein